MSSSVIRLALIFFCVCIESIVHAQSCTLDVKNLPELSPIFITSEKQLAKHVGTILSWKLGEKGEILCNGRENALAAYGKKRAEIRCTKDGLFVDGEKPRNFKCLKDNQADVMISKDACIGGGVFKYIGFRANDKTFVKYIKICYNDKKASPVYTYHTIWGKGARYIKNYQRPFFAIPGVPNVNCYEAYVEQKNTLRNLLGNKAKFYIKEDSPTFTRGHLTPSRDGLFKSWQIATFYYINSAPQFGLVNGNNWHTVEILVRNKAIDLKDEVEVYTGISGVLSLPNATNRLSPIYLQKRDEQKVMPVPKWFWKIVKYKESGIAFVTLNNPHVTAIRPICENICKTHGWDDDDFANFKYGYTICCTVESLIKVFPEVPQKAGVKNILAN